MALSFFLLTTTTCSLLLNGVVGQNTTTSNSTTPTTNSTAPIPTAPSDCNCGFSDPVTGATYTDSIIVYFNETADVPQDVFSVDTFEHPYEKSWTIFYREGARATPQNVYIQNGSVWNLQPSWLNLNVSGYTPEHLVNGAQLSTLRKDIQYGTFRVFMRSPAPYASGGSALTMRLEYNDTSSAELDLLNADDSADNAYMQTSTRNEVPVPAWGTNYNVLKTDPYNQSPWDFWEWRMDWNEQQIDWYCGANHTRTVPTTNASLVDTPAAFHLKHWSTGDATFMGGPPTNDSGAAIGWVRLFFNSSLPTTSQLGSPQCDASQMCSTDNWLLRQSTAYGPDATVRRKPDTTTQSKSRAAGIALCSVSLAFGIALFLQAFLRKATGKRGSDGFPPGRRPKMMTSPWPSTDGLNQSRDPSQAWTTQADYEMNDFAASGTSSTTLRDPSDRGGPLGFLGKHGRTVSSRPLLGHYDSTAASSTTFAQPETPAASDWNSPYFEQKPGGDPITPVRAREGGTSGPPMTPMTPMTPAGMPMTPADASTVDLLAKASSPKALAQVEPEGSAAAANPGAKPTPKPAGLPKARNRIDYLAGLVALMSLLVSCEHFILTYVPSVVEEYLPRHYESEYWARRTIEPFFFNEVLVGLFFTTSTRFLASGFLRTGSLKTIAEKVVCRCPRLMIPITAVITLEYFLMDVGAVKYLEYIPSITWSTWPSTAVFPNFGYFIDETLQLFYLLPNAAPNITWNYCTGVLWTIPVQLQFSWVILLGAVVVREIKTPWKRFAYYAFCILNAWYALNWGSYFWSGLLLADLDITYKYRKAIQSRAWLHYPLLSLAVLLMLLALANDLFSVWFGFTFSTAERGIHPDVQTGLPLAQTANAGYPAYTEPKLNGLVFAVCSQYIVEISTWVQAVLSTKLFLWLFPHVFTIYLIHGLVLWSMGSLVCVFFAGQGLPYWANMLLTALICYTTLFSILPIVTPVMEMLGKEITKGIWVAASEEPAAWRPTSHPFGVEDIRGLVYRKDDEDDEEGEEEGFRPVSYTHLTLPTKRIV